MAARAPDNYNGRVSCQVSGKKRYRGRKQAKTGANMVGAEHEVELDIYKCPLCKDWHLTEVK